jgi:hypothetical protein
LHPQKLPEEKKKLHCYDSPETAEKSMQKIVMEKICLFGSNSKVKKKAAYA